MKHILLTLFILPLCMSFETKATFPPVTVFELFTSQGCSSCPPADELLMHIQNSNHEQEIIALSYHVDYWNYIGWKDPFSSSTFSKKQSIYNKKFNNQTNYTPQVVVNGSEHFVGSNKNIMHKMIKKFARIAAENKIDISEVKQNDKSLGFDFNIHGTIQGKILRVLLVIDERETNVSSGENRNRRLQNSNIVVSETSIALTSQQGSRHIPIPKIVNHEDHLSLVLMIQDSDLKIVAANKLKL